MKLPKCYQPIYVITRTLCFTGYIKQYDHHHLKHRCVYCFCLRFYYLFVFLDFYYKCLLDGYFVGICPFLRTAVF